MYIHKIEALERSETVVTVKNIIGPDLFYSNISPTPDMFTRTIKNRTPLAEG